MADEVPAVTGISPKEGYPGTKITIRGENLGESKDDVVELTIKGKSCLESLEYISSKKLMCLSPDIIGRCQIIVTTQYGGEGTCSVIFTGLEPDRKPELDPLEESNVWVDEAYNPQAPGLSNTTEEPIYLHISEDPLAISGGSWRKDKRRPSQQNLETFFPSSSGDLLARNFNPKWYLAEKHRTTSFSDLKTGLRRLRRELDRSEEAPVEFMRDNLLTFLQTYDTLSDVNEQLIRNESEYTGGSITDKVEELLKDAAKHAEEVFDGIIKCKVRADQTRTALTVLQRYRFLFNLPRSIEKNITNEEYDLVTTDYERAKSLFANTSVKAFKKIMDEVEKQIQTFRQTLKKKLRVFPSTLEEQKKIIKYLLELDCDGDPAWECITNVQQWLLKRLFTSKANYQNPGYPPRGAGELSALPPSLVIEQDIPPDLPPRRGTVVSEEESGHSRTLSDLSSASYGSHGNAPPPVPPSPLRSHQRNASSGGRGGSDASGRPMKILLVEEMTNIMNETFPDLWRLGNAYFTGSLFTGVMFQTEKQQQLARNCEVNQPRFESMILEVVEVYTDMVNCSLFEDAYEKLPEKKKVRLGEWIEVSDPLMENSGDWLPQIVRQIRECVGLLQGLSLPEKAVSITSQLALNVRILCANTLFNRAASDISVLHEREDWRMQTEEGGIVTSLPILFENMVVEVLIALKEVVVDPHSEVMDVLNKELLDSSRQHLHALLEHFISCFDFLAFHEEGELRKESITMLTPGQTVGESNEELEAAAPTSDEKLLMILSNLRYVMREVIPRLFHCFVSHGYPPAEMVREDILEKLHELDEKVFFVYIEHKSENVTGIMEGGMKAGFFDWESRNQPTSVRNYIKEVLFNLVLIHAEVHAVSSQIVHRILSRLVDLLSEEFFNLICDVDNTYSAEGIVYAYIEMGCLEEVLEPYLTEKSFSHFDECRTFLNKWDVRADESVHKVVDTFKEKTKLQLRCFRLPSVDSTILEEEVLSPSPSLLSPPPPLPEELPKPQTSFMKFREPPKEEIAAPPVKKETVAEPQDEFKKVRRYKQMPEGF